MSAFRDCEFCGDEHDRCDGCGLVTTERICPDCRHPTCEIEAREVGDRREARGLTRVPVLVPARDWTDDDGEPLGSWLEVDLLDWRAVLADAGGLEALTVFAGLTDPEGCYGSPQVYTAWGRRESATPLLDVRDYYDRGREGGVTQSTLRKFVVSARDDR